VTILSRPDDIPYYVAGDWYECPIDEALRSIARNELAGWTITRSGAAAPPPNPDAWLALSPPCAPRPVGRNRAERRARR